MLRSRDDKKKRLIFVIDSGAVKVNSSFSNKLHISITKNSLTLPLIDEGQLHPFCVKVKTEAEAEALKQKIEESFAFLVCCNLGVLSRENPVESGIMWESIIINYYCTSH